VLSKYQGESERALQSVFAAAKDAAPSVIFLDELVRAYQNGTHTCVTRDMCVHVCGMLATLVEPTIAAVLWPDVVSLLLLCNSRRSGMHCTVLYNAYLAKTVLVSAHTCSHYY
jgi:ATPase family associated with various cellular activities (AAA)